MNTKAIMNQLSSIECDLYYAVDDDKTNGLDPKAIADFRKKVAELMGEWYELTGETI